MTNLIIILLLLVAALGGAAYGIVTGLQNLQNMTEKVATETRLEEAAQGILANIYSTTTSSAQNFAVPMPDNYATSPAVPSWITPNAQTSTGTKFLYCPFTNINTGTRATTITTPAGSYAVNAATAYSGSQSYVTISDARPANAPTTLAILVAPAARSSTLPDCQAIGADLTLAGAIVRVITEEEVFARQAVTASTGIELYAGVSATGDASGRNAANQATFAAAMGYINTYRPQAVKVNLAAGTYLQSVTNLVGQNASIVRANSTRNHSIHFIGAGMDATSFTQNNQVNYYIPMYFFGSVLYQDLGFPPYSTNLTQPTTNGINSQIIDRVSMSFPYTYTGKTLYLGPVKSAGSNGSGNNEWNRVYADGTVYIGNYLSSPPIGTGFPMTYGYSAIAEGFLGGHIIVGADGLVNMLGSGSCGTTIISPCGNNWFYTGYGSDQIIQGTLTQSAYTLAAPAISFGTPGSIAVLSGATVTNLSQPVAGGEAGFTFASDRGSVISLSSGTKPARFLGDSANSYAAEFALTNSTFGDSTNRPGTSTVFTGAALGLNSMAGGTTGGWGLTTLYGASSGTYGCWDTTDTTNNYHLTTDSAQPAVAGNGVSTPLGSSGYEPLIIANRSYWSCQR